MTQPNREWRDEDTRDALHEMRREEEAIAGRYRPLRWIRTKHETRSFRRRALAFAGSFGVLGTIAIVLWVVELPRMKPEAPPESRSNVLVVKKYAPPPPKIERKIINKTKSSKLIPVPNSVPDAELLKSLGYIGSGPIHEEPVFAQSMAYEPSPEDIARMSTESYSAIDDNPFHTVIDEPLSTFSADVDTASYSNVRRFINQGRMPPGDAVRVEELINYFDYEHPSAHGNDPFGVVVEIGDCPWNQLHRLARITLAARSESRDDYRGSNLVFLLDVSGSMNASNKLPLVRQSMRLLADQLDDRDTVSIVVYAGASGLVLDATPGSDHAAIVEALDGLRAGGSTAGAEGLQLAYLVARANFIEGGVNRVILATDGDFNVGPTSQTELLRIIEKDARRGIFLTALGFGMGNYKDDRLEQLADRGNGNYAYIDDLREARKVLVEEIGGTLVTVAKDVKFQVEFNLREVGAYRLIGYENRLLAHRDFDDDAKDAGDVGAGHTVTVLYELIPPGAPGTESEVESLRYRKSTQPTRTASSGESFWLKIRFKEPDGDASELRTYAAHDESSSLAATSDDFRFAAAVAAFGMRLRESAAVRDFAWGEIDRLASGAIGPDEHGHRAGFVELVVSASRLDPNGE